MALPLISPPAGARRRPDPRPLLALVAAAVFVLAGACSSGSDSGSPPAPSGSSTTSAGSTTGPTTSVPSATAGGPTATSPPSGPTTAIADECTADELAVRLGRAGAAAGTAYVAVVFTNRGSRTCSMQGYPGVSYVDAAGAQIGAAARRDPNPAETRVPLAPGTAAHALVGTANTGNYDPATCGTPVTAHALRIYPPDSTTAIDLPASTSICPDDVGQLSVQAVAPGADEGGG